MLENCLSTYLVCHLEKLMMSLAWSGVPRSIEMAPIEVISCHGCRPRQIYSVHCQSVFVVLVSCTLFSDKSGM